MKQAIPVYRNAIAVPQTGEKAYYRFPYKEPFTPLENGYGYLGVLLSNEEGLVLCSTCGKWFNSVSKHTTSRAKTVGDHLPSAEYRKEYGFTKHAALCSEASRVSHIDNAYRMLSTGKFGYKYAKSVGRAPVLNGAELRRGKKCETHDSAEYKNRHVVCRQQLLERLREVGRKSNGIITSTAIRKMDDRALLYYLDKEFGSYKEAAKLCNLYMKELSRDISREMMIEDAKNFYKRFGRSVSISDFKRGNILGSDFLMRKYFGNIDGLAKAAGIPYRCIAMNLPIVDVITKYTNGASIRDLSEEYNCPIEVITRHFRRIGIKVRPGNEQMAIWHKKQREQRLGLIRQKIENDLDQANEDVIRKKDY